MKDLADQVPAYQWIVAITQLSAQLGSRKAETMATIVQSIVVKVMSRYSRQALWALMGVANMEQTETAKARRNAAIALMKKMGKKNQGLKRAFVDLSRLEDQLVRLARKDVPKPSHGKTSEISSQIGKTLRLEESGLVMPTQLMLTVTLPGPESHALSDLDHEGFPKEAGRLVTIRKFSRIVKVMSSQEKPKKVQVQGSDGLYYNFLCKAERKSDLRKDSRMMSLFSLVNRLLQQDPEGRRRHLRRV